MRSFSRRHVTATLGVCRKKNFSRSVTGHDACRIEWNSTVRDSNYEGMRANKWGVVWAKDIETALLYMLRYAQIRVKRTLSNSDCEISSPKCTRRTLIWYGVKGKNMGWTEKKDEIRWYTRILWRPLQDGHWLQVGRRHWKRLAVDLDTYLMKLPDSWLPQIGCPWTISWAEQGGGWRLDVLYIPVCLIQSSCCVLLGLIPSLPESIPRSHFPSVRIFREVNLTHFFRYVSPSTCQFTVEIRPVM